MLPAEDAALNAYPAPANHLLSSSQLPAAGTTPTHAEPSDGHNFDHQGVHREDVAKP